MAKKEQLSLEGLLEQALVKDEDKPYEVPGNWVWTRLGAVCVINPPKVNSKSLPEELEVSFIPMSAVSEISGTVVGSEIRKLYEVKNGYTNFLDNDVLFAKITPCMENGKSAIVTNLANGIGYGSTEFYVFRVNKCVLNKFIYCLVRAKWFIEEAQMHMSGSVGQQRVPKHYLENYNFPLPPLPEQQRIVALIESLFEKLDRAKELAQNALDSFENRKSAILHKAFTGELTRQWREENGVELDNWKDSRLKNIAEIISGTNFKSEDFSQKNVVSCVKISNVGVGYFDDANVDYLPSEFLVDFQKQIVKCNDVLIALTRPFINAGLKTCIYRKEKESLLNQRVALIRGGNGQYIYHYLRTSIVLEYIKEKSKTTNQPNLSIKDLEKLQIPCPTLC